MVSLEDVTVKFTCEEWQNLNNALKMLYRNVMLETYSSLLSLGQYIPKPELIFKLEEGEEPWTAEEPANKTLPVFCGVDAIIETNQKNQERHLWHVTSNGHNKANEEAEGLENTFYLYSMNISSSVACSHLKFHLSCILVSKIIPMAPSTAQPAKGIWFPSGQMITEEEERMHK
ncbi:zinc finger protein 39-like [Apodemus sylvaticus]|uniref:zinc finger protein 39-like n=1 Tax=Apodemus sylvaticus TaxID=10129 RepID=UPI002244F270|nr:zinc finger protein 39-like [Apodemus sylvaticus]